MSGKRRQATFLIETELMQAFRELEREGGVTLSSLCRGAVVDFLRSRGVDAVDNTPPNGLIRAYHKRHFEQKAAAQQAA